jgi:putative NADH-flavin reductase
MATYTVIGATGNCGSAIIEILLQSPDAKVHAYCRNKAKLIGLMPEVLQTARVQIFEGQIDDLELLTKCIHGNRAIFLCATSNNNIPGIRVAQGSAKTVLTALERLRAESGPEGVPSLPKIVLLSSATIDPHLNRKMPWWFLPIMLRAASHVYDDLAVAESLLRAQQEWVTSIFIKPGGLAIDKQRGHKLNFDEEESFIAYLDLAAAMVEAVDDPDGRYDMKNVSVVNTGGSAAFPKGTPACILYGLLRHFFPWLHPYLPTSGP